MPPHLRKVPADELNCNMQHNNIYLVSGVNGINGPINEAPDLHMLGSDEFGSTDNFNDDVPQFSGGSLHHVSTQDPLVDSTETLQKDPEDDNNQQHPEMSMVRKFLFGFAAPPSAMCGNILGFLMSIFLLEVANLSPKLVLIITLLGRIWDAVSDPVVGYLVSKTRSRFGQCRPWILASAPLAAASFLFFFNTPGFQSDSMKFGYFLVFYLLFLTFITTYHIPYTSLTMLVSHRSEDRDAATTIRMMFEMGGTLLGTILFASITTIKDRCDGAIAGGLNSTSVTITSEIARALNEQDRYRIGGLVIGSIVITNGLVGFLGTKEVVRPTKKSMQDIGHVTILKTFKRCLRHKTYLILMFTFMLASLSIQVIQACLALYTKYSLNMKEHLVYAIAIVMTVSILATPIIFYLIRRVGKKKVFFMGLLLIFPVCISAYMCPSEGNYVALFYLTMVIAGCFAGINMLLPWIMLPDVIDDYTAQTGFRDEAAFYSLYNFFSKFAVGISQGLIQLSLHFAGYQTELPCDEKQPESVGQALRILMGPAPAVLVIGACILLYFYPITPEYRKNLDRKLTIQRAEISLPKDLACYVETSVNLQLTHSRDKILFSSQESQTVMC